MAPLVNEARAAAAPATHPALDSAPAPGAAAHRRTGRTRLRRVRGRRGNGARARRRGSSLPRPAPPWAPRSQAALCERSRGRRFVPDDDRGRHGAAAAQPTEPRASGSHDLGPRAPQSNRTVWIVIGLIATIAVGIVDQVAALSPDRNAIRTGTRPRWPRRPASAAVSDRARRCRDGRGRSRPMPPASSWLRWMQLGSQLRWTPVWSRPPADARSGRRARARDAAARSSRRMPRRSPRPTPAPLRSSVATSWSTRARAERRGVHRRRRRRRDPGQAPRHP